MNSGPEVMLILSITIQVQVFQKVIDASFVTIWPTIQSSDI